MRIPYCVHRSRGRLSSRYAKDRVCRMLRDTGRCTGAGMWIACYHSHVGDLWEIRLTALRAVRDGAACEQTSHVYVPGAPSLSGCFSRGAWVSVVLQPYILVISSLSDRHLRFYQILHAPIAGRLARGFTRATAERLQAEGSQ